MSDFATAVTTLEMALKAFQLEGKITVQMDSEAQTIVLGDAVMVSQRPGKTLWVTEELAEGYHNHRLARTEDVVAAVVEAVTYLIAKQARESLYEMFDSGTVSDSFEES